VVERVENKVAQQVCKMVEEEHVRQVPVTTCRMVHEERVEQIPVQICRKVAYEQTVRVPRVVEKRIPVTYTLQVPRCVVHRVPIDPCTGADLAVPATVPAAVPAGVAPGVELGTKPALPADPAPPATAADDDGKKSVLKPGAIPKEESRDPIDAPATKPEGADRSYDDRGAKGANKQAQEWRPARGRVQRVAQNP
jgi:hypothetical protein